MKLKHTVSITVIFSILASMVFISMNSFSNGLYKKTESMALIKPGKLDTRDRDTGESIMVYVKPFLMDKI